MRERIMLGVVQDKVYAEISLVEQTVETKMMQKTLQVNRLDR